MHVIWTSGGDAGQYAVHDSFTAPLNTNWGSGMAATAGSDGKPWLAFLEGQDVADLHYGHAEQVLSVSGCCRYETGIGTDGQSGATWVTWNSNASPKAGIYYRKLVASGAAAGPAARAPGSTNTSILLQRMTAVGRGKGRSGVYITYLTGSPFPAAVRLYRLGARTAATVEKLEAESTVGLSMLTADPAGTSDVWRVYLSATKSHLDVLALLTVHGKMSYWHTQVLAPR